MTQLGSPKARAIFAVFVAGWALLVSPKGAEAAFGISPPFMNPTNLLRGSRYVQTIYLVQDQPNQDLPIEAKLDVPAAIRSWFTLETGERFVIPQGTRQFPVNIAVQVPEDTNLGVYSGKLLFTSIPGQAGQVTVALGAQVDINLTVGNDIVRKLLIPVVRPLDIEEGWAPRVYVKANNEGNVAERFDGATFELFDQFGGVRLAYIQKGRDFPEFPPFEVSEFTVEFPTDFHMGLGQYWASITFLQEGKAVVSQRTVFNVLKRGSLSSPFQKFLQNARDKWPYYAGGGALLAIGVFALLRKKRRG